MITKIESATFVYDNGELVAIIKRDEKTRKNLVYMAQEADAEQITELITPREEGRMILVPKGQLLPHGKIQ